MKIKSYRESFEQLEDLYSQMKAVLEWGKLKTEERNRNPSFRLFFHDSSMEEMLDLKSKFFSGSIQLRLDLLEKNKNLPKEHKNQLINKLTTLEQKVYYLGSNVRIF